MDPVARTAYYCCGVRAADAKTSEPICGDQFAECFMTAEGVEAFSHFNKPGFKIPNTSNAARARIIDDIIRAEIAARPDVPVFLVGAGFDTRAYRLGGGRWVEFDQPELLERKNAFLPTSKCPAALKRVAVNFFKAELERKLSPWNGTAGAIVVFEGVSEYLTQQQLAATLGTLRAALPGHTLLCDLMNERFRLKFTGPFRLELRKLGTDFETLSFTPEKTVIDAGYNLHSSQSIIGKARELGKLRIPGLLFNTVLRLMRDGYQVYRFGAR